MNESIDTSLHQRRMPVQQITQAVSGEFEVGQDLRLVDRENPLNRLVLDDHQSFNQHVQPVANIESEFSIRERHPNLTLHYQPGPLEFMGEACLIRGLEKPRTKGPMNSDRATDDRSSETVEVVPVIALHFFSLRNAGAGADEGLLSRLR